MSQHHPHFNGTVNQSQHRINTNDYKHVRISHPVVGIVLDLHMSDSQINRSAAFKSDQRGSHIEARVWVVNDGKDTPWPIPNVVIPPCGASGVDDYHEELPRGCSMMIDESEYNQNFVNTDPRRLDGDWCVVAFIGGHISQPVMIGWWPHPGNCVDPATNAEPVLDADGHTVKSSTLKQGRRIFKRYQGAKLTVTNQGSLYIDTNESGALIKGSDKSQIVRKPRDAGGDIQVDVKNSRRFEVNFNPSVPLPDTEPSLPQPNPPTGVTKTRADTATRLTFDKDNVHMYAGKDVAISANGATIQIDKDSSITLSYFKNSISIDSRDASKGIKILDENQQSVTVDKDGIVLIDADGSSISMDGTGTTQIGATDVLVIGETIGLSAGATTIGNAEDLTVTLSAMVRGTELKTALITFATGLTIATLAAKAAALIVSLNLVSPAPGACFSTANKVK